MKSARSVARTGACAFALGVGLALAAGAGAADANAAPAGAGASSGSSSNTGASASGDGSSSVTGHRRAQGAKPSVAARTTVASSSAPTTKSATVRTAESGESRSAAVFSATAQSGSAADIPASLTRRSVSRSSLLAPAIGGTTTAPVSPAVPVPANQPLVDALGLAAREAEGRMYGNPTLNSKYWVAQHSMNCMLMATAAVIGQLTGKTPTEPQIVFEASTTPSVVVEGTNMYLGLKSNTGVRTQDALALLRNHGISTDLTAYTNSDAAMEALKTAIDDPDKAVIVAVNGGVIWHATYGSDLPPNANVANHAVVVIGVDTANNIVHLNDSGMSDQFNQATGRPWGQDLQVPLDDFIQAWKTSNYLLMSASVTANPEPRAAWVDLAPRRDIANYLVNTPFALGDLRNTDPDAAAHLAHYRN